jgi:aminopeptidase N
MVAIPDFVSGAMEHWGLVTYRETALLYDPKTHSVSNKQRVAEVVAHELAHSWFGNLGKIFISNEKNFEMRHAKIVTLKSVRFEP